MKTINFFRSKLFALTLALMASVSSFAYDEMPDFQVDGLYYNFLEEDNVEVTHPYIPVVPVENVASNTKKKSHAISADDYYNLTNLVIPSTVTYEGKVYNVTRIGFDAFNQCDKLTFVDIPSSVKTIGGGAFNFCSSLTSITLKEGLEHIEWNAFEDCRSLENITFPNSLKTIGNYAFSNTLWYKNHPNGAVYASNVFYKYKGDIPQNTSFVIKEGIVSISPYAFVKENYHEDYSLVSVSIPNSVKVIGEGVFYRCRALTSIVIPDEVTTIETLAFHYCKALKSVTCEAVNPPALSGSVFLSTPIADATLYVPAESLEAYKSADQWKDFGQILPIKESFEDLFPTLTGLQRTSCTKTIGEDEYGTVWGSRSYLMQEIQTTTIDGKQYLLFGTNNTYDEYCSLWLREENNKILVYSTAQKKDLVLYDFTLNVGDSLSRLYVDYELSSVVDYYKYMEGYASTDPLVVTEVSTITLLDGKEHKKWTFNNGMQYVEGIGSFGTCYAHNDFYQLIANAPLSSDVYSQYLVCASRNGQLLYKMDEAEMERLGAECLCEVETSYKSQWCNKWNVMWFDGMRFDETARTSKYRLGKDTVIGDYTYSKFISGTYVRFTDDRKVYVYHEYFDDHDPYSEDLPTGEYLAYDFSAQVGDTLEVFSGIGTYSTYPCVVDDVQIDSETNLRTMTLHKICRIEDDGFFEEYDDMEMTWIEGVGSPEGFLISYLPCGWVGGGTYALLCAYQDDELKYTGSLYERFGCDYKAGVVSDDLFPTLSGLQRTICREYCEQADNKTRIEQFTNLTTRTETGGPYLYYSPFLLREKDNKILIYSRTLNKDLVLYDFNLQVGDSLPMLYIDTEAKDDWIADRDMDIWYVVDYHKDLEGNILPADTLIVTDVSMITLLDGKEYKKWTFNNGMEYVEGIGSFGNAQWSGDFFQLIANRAVPTSLQGEHLVCVSKNNKLLYQMDDAEMERLGTECLCDYDRGPRKDNAKNGQIGGRPTPTQWNQLEVVLRQMDNNHTILQAETFSYTLEDISQQVNNKTYFQLARQSTKDTATTKSVVGALHFGKDEDNRVYFLRDGVEYVLYDFTAEIGDTVEIFAGINNYPQETTYTHMVVDKDTTEDGACRMFLEVVFPDETTTATNAEKVWLAGLGSIDGIVHNAAQRTSDAHAAPAKSASSETQTSVMLCAWREDSCLYTTNHPEYDTFGCVYNQDPTAVENLTSPTSYQKIIHEGTLLILHEGKVYNVIGIQIK